MNYKTKSNELPLVADCNGCGVCCLHMGYPPFIRPTEQREGESWWYLLPDDLRMELDQFIANYDAPVYGDSVETFDGPCCWFDLESRQCRHHQHRPNVCRDFETGSKQCHEWRRHYADRIESR